MAPLTKTILITSLLTSLTPFLTSASTINFPRAIDGGCIGDKGAPGVCVSTTNCKNAGGKPIDNACPKDGPDIKCCTKPSCGTGGKGNCRFTSSCDSGVTEFNKCPGPTAFRCCMPKGSGSSDPPPPSGGGDGDQPELPSTDSKCKSVAIAGAKKIIEQFPGVVTSIGCIRTTEKCKTDPSSSEHCTGMATDMMLPLRSPQGEPIAEWVMKNRGSLSLRYVMWGQKIWEASKDREESWGGWRYQSCTVIPNCKDGDRGDTTQNHWDHVHVSYN